MDKNQGQVTFSLLLIGRDALVRVHTHGVMTPVEGVCLEDMKHMVVAHVVRSLRWLYFTSLLMI